MFRKKSVLVQELQNILFILMILFVLPLTACGKDDKQVIEITVPAGSQEDFVYSEEEIMATSNQITIWSGAGLGDTEVILKPVDENVETGYVAEYLTHGMPVKLDAVKGQWFKVGVAVQNDSERGPIAVSVEVEGVEVRSAETAGAKEKDVSSEDLLLVTDTFWNNVTKVVYYDFNEDIYEVSDVKKLEEIQAIFTEMKYKEIKNPWLEGWYLFKIHTNEKVYDMSITGKTIRFDEKFYKVTKSIAEEIVKISNSKDYPPKYVEMNVLSHSPEALIERAKHSHMYVAYDNSKIIGCGAIAEFGESKTESILLTIFVLPKPELFTVLR